MYIPIMPGRYTHASLAIAALAALCVATGHAQDACTLRPDTLRPALSEAPPDERLFAHSLGEVRAALIFIDFPDAPGTADVAQLAPSYTNEASAWYASASRGRMSLSFTVAPRWYRMSKPSATYVNEIGKFVDVIAAAAEAINLAAGDVDFTRVTHVYIAASNHSAVNKSNAFMAPVGRGAKFDRGEIRFGAAFGSNVYRTIPTGSYPAHHLTHETLHTLGLPDLYDITIADIVQNASATGGWDPMGWVLSLGEPLVWHKRLLGWIDPPELHCVERADTAITVRESLVPAGETGAKAVAVRLDRYRVLVAEARVPRGLDSLRGPGGVLVYTVDVRVPTGRTPVRVISAAGGPAADDSSRVRRLGPLHDATLSADTGRRSRLDVPDAGVSVEVTRSSTARFDVVLLIAPRPRSAGGGMLPVHDPTRVRQ